MSRKWRRRRWCFRLDVIVINIITSTIAVVVMVIVVIMIVIVVVRRNGRSKRRRDAHGTFDDGREADPVGEGFALATGVDGLNFVGAHGAFRGGHVGQVEGAVGEASIICERYGGRNLSIRRRGARRRRAVHLGRGQPYDALRRLQSIHLLRASAHHFLD